jgi:aminopeptidase N
VDVRRLDPDLFSEQVDPSDPASPTFGGIAEGSLARQDEILDFLKRRFSRYPFSTGGGIVDENLLFALETQTRPVYSKYFFTSPANGDSVVVHEVAHQWFGDSVALAEWKHIWLNEGFAQYAEWMWSEEQGLGTAQEQFDAVSSIPAGDPFWSVVIGDPGPELLFDNAVYLRGGMAVHALRLEVGDRDFFRILHAWTTRKAGGNGTIPQFMALAERVSGEQLDDLFRVWLFTGSKPVLEAAAAAKASAASPSAAATLEQARGRERLRR